MQKQFDYVQAFIRNIGWLNEAEQQFLRSQKIAIAGMGGVGGIHLMTLVRLGFEQFHIADFDDFQLQNFNRQAGATINNLNCPKLDVLEKMAKEINPNVTFELFHQGIDEQNIDEFLNGVNLYVDGLDFFVLDIREQVFRKAYEKNIPAITAGPLGMGTTYLIFMPGKMPFWQYFHFNQVSKEERPIYFLVGLNPKLFNRHYLMVPDSVNFNLQQGPSTIIACQLCAGVMGAEAVKILLHRGPIYAAPYYHVFDPYICKHRIGWMPWGNANPLQQAKIFFMKKRLRRKAPPDHQPLTPLEQILDLGRWAPSGDNLQPWRFEIINEKQVKIHIENEATISPYDFKGIPTLISCGCLLETIRLAATLFHWGMHYESHTISSTKTQLDVHFFEADTAINSLVYCIKQRSVNRELFSRTSLTSAIKCQLNEVVGGDFAIIWLNTLKDKKSIAKLTSSATRIRMLMPELHAIHQRVFRVEKQAKEGIPVKALGMNPISQILMKWSLKSWGRMKIINQLGAIKLSNLELDVLPSFYAGAHFILVDKEARDCEKSMDYYLQVGQAMQRFWLKATQLGLAIQPNFAPLIFSYYANQKIRLTDNDMINSLAKKIADQMNTLTNQSPALFIGRIGYAKQKKRDSRSIRKSLNELIINKGKYA